MATSKPEGMSVVVPTTGYRRFLFFNRFSVEREDGFVHMQFGFVNKLNLLVDSYATVISEPELAVLRKSTIDYLGSHGTLLEAPPTWQPTAPMLTEVANHIVMSRHGGVAEIIFYSFSFWSAVDAARRAALLKEAKQAPETANVIAEPMALLRSPLRAQQHLIRLLFPQGEASFTDE